MGDNFLLISMSVCTYSFVVVFGEKLGFLDKVFKTIYSIAIFFITLLAISFCIDPVIFAIILSCVSGVAIFYRTKNLFFSTVLFSTIKLANTVIWFTIFEILMIIYRKSEINTEEIFRSVAAIVSVMGILYILLMWGLLNINKKYKIFEFILETDKKNYISVGLLLTFSVVGDYFNFGMRKTIANEVTGHFVVYYFELLIFIVVVKYLIIKERIMLLYFNEEKKYSQSLNQELLELKGFKHDYRNILLSMKTLIEEKQYAQLESYFFNELLPEVQVNILKENIVQQLHSLATPQIRSLIIEKYTISEHYGIPFVVDVKSDNLPIRKNLVKINRLIGILLDNAIEESKNVEHPTIFFKVFMKDEKIVIQVSNKTLLKKVNITDFMKEGYSTKGENRGYGLASFHKIVSELTEVDYLIESNNYRIDCYLNIKI